MSKVVKKIREVLSYGPIAGSASPKGWSFFETSDLPLDQVMMLYDRDPTCKASVDLLAASTVKRFYTTSSSDVNGEKAKKAVDDFCEKVNLDGLLHDMAARLIGCGNDFWLKLSSEFLPLPLDAVEKVNLSSVSGFRIPYKVESFKLKSTYCELGGGNAESILKPDVVLHWKLAGPVFNGFGVGLLQVLLHTLTVGGNKRPAYAWMKSKIERLMPKILRSMRVLMWLLGCLVLSLTRFQSLRLLLRIVLRRVFGCFTVKRMRLLMRFRLIRVLRASRITLITW